MTKIIHRTGDIFTTQARGIGHGVNVKGAMGSGIAIQFKERFPSMHTRYMSLCRVGTLTPGDVYAYEAAMGYFVYNIASQNNPGADADLTHLRNGVQAALEHAELHKIFLIALPRIGSGIGGLDQNEVEQVLQELATASPVDIELWTYDK